MPAAHGRAFNSTLRRRLVSDLRRRQHERSREALALAHKIAQPFGLAFALVAAAMLHLILQEHQQAQELADAAITLSTEQGFPYYLAWATILQGSSLVDQGNAEAGIEQITQGRAAYLATGAQLSHSYFLGLLAAACGRSGRVQEGLGVLTDALTVADQTGEHFHEAELHRLKGELLLEHSSDRTRDTVDRHQAEACFQQAIAIAVEQHATSLQLRAALSLARLWQTEGRTGEAGRMLSRVHDVFTEGSDTADLRQARELLGEMANETGSRRQR